LTTMKVDSEVACMLGFVLIIFCTKLEVPIFTLNYDNAKGNTKRK